MRRIIVVCLMWAVPILASSGAAGFLSNGFQAKISSLGGISTSEGIDSVGGNPAGLAGGASVVVAGTAFRYLEMDYGVLGLAWRTPDWGIGLGYVVGQIGSMGTSATGFDNRLVETGQSVDYLGNSIVAAFGLSVLPNMALGVAAKTVYESGVGYQATGVGADVGVIASVMPWLKLGVLGKNVIQPKMEWDTPSKPVDTVDQEWTVGARVSGFEDRVSTTVDWGYLGSEPIYRLGIDYQIEQIAAVWGGLSTRGWSVGTGLRLGNGGVDFSYLSPSTEGLEAAYRLGMTLEFK